jgi:hypothetical protein
MNDISLAGYAWVPIGDGYAGAFRGTFNGANRTISGLSCSGYYYAGLFGVLSQGAQIYNLNIAGCNITGADNTGGLAGFLDHNSGETGSTRIRNCHVSGTISGGNTGGLIGMVLNVFDNTINSIFVEYCSSSATVSGGGYVGGLIGNIEGSSMFGGAIKPQIRYCYSSGSVNGGGTVGGLIGELMDGWLANCYSASTITTGAASVAGGLVGDASSSTISKSFSTGLVSPGTGRGFIGENNETGVTECYWDTETSGQSSSNGGGTGKTTAQMKNQATFTNYQFGTEWAMSDTVNNGYPYLSPWFTWAGRINDDWNNANNWDFYAVPPPGATVIIGPYPGAVSLNPFIGQGTSSPVRLVNLMFQSLTSLTVTSGSALTVQGQMTLGSGEKLIIETEGSFIDNGITGAGTVKVKHALSGNRWWYIGSPMTNATAGSFGPLSPTPNTGTRLFYWNEPSNGYVNMTDSSTVLAPLKGYSYKNFAGADTATFTGTLNSGLIGTDNNLTFTVGGVNAGYNLVCNPFPSAINWGSPATPATGLIRTGIETTIWYRANSTYSTYNSTSGTGTGNPVGQQYIPAMQAFWVHVSDTVSRQGTLKIGNASRVHNSQPFYKSSGESNIFRLFVKRDTLQDDIAVGFYEQALPGYDPYDSQKRFNDAAYPQLFTLTSDGIVVVINGQPPMQDQDSLVIPLGFGTSVGGVFTMEATNVDEFDPGLTVKLVDRPNGISQDLRTNSVYHFQSDAVNPDTERFSLIFSKKGAGANELADPSLVRIFSSSNTLYVDLLGGGQANVEIYNMLGQKVITQTVETGLNQIAVNSLMGVYIARVQKGDRFFTKKIFLGK